MLGFIFHVLPDKSCPFVVQYEKTNIQILIEISFMKVNCVNFQGNELVPDKQVCTYYDQLFELHYPNFHLHLLHVHYHRFQFVDRFYLQVLVVFHVHRFRNQRQAIRTNIHLEEKQNDKILIY